MKPGDTRREHCRHSRSVCDTVNVKHGDATNASIRVEGSPATVANLAEIEAQTTERRSHQFHTKCDTDLSILLQTIVSNSHHAVIVLIN